MIILDVPEMHCNKCVERITKALEDDKLSFTVSLEDKSVSIDGCQSCASTAKRGSISFFGQPQSPYFKDLPHLGQRPGQSSEQRSFFGNPRISSSERGSSTSSSEP